MLCGHRTLDEMAGVLFMATSVAAKTQLWGLGSPRRGPAASCKFTLIRVGVERGGGPKAALAGGLDPVRDGEADAGPVVGFDLDFSSSAGGVERGSGYNQPLACSV